MQSRVVFVTVPSAHNMHQMLEMALHLMVTYWSTETAKVCRSYSYEMAKPRSKAKAGFLQRLSSQLLYYYVSFVNSTHGMHVSLQLVLPFRERPCPQHTILPPVSVKFHSDPTKWPCMEHAASYRLDILSYTQQAAFSFWFNVLSIHSVVIDDLWSGL